MQTNQTRFASDTEAPPGRSYEIYMLLRILILTFCYPPARYVAAQRPSAIAHQLVGSGHEVTVITRNWGESGSVGYFQRSESSRTKTEYKRGVKVIQAPFRGVYTLGIENGRFVDSALRKAATFCTYLLQYFLKVGPMCSIYFAAKDEINNKNYDVIIAHGEPFVLFTYAKQLSASSGIPWVADYRDPWSMNLIAKRGNISRRILNHVEQRTVESASMVTCATDYVAQMSVPVRNKIVVKNGYAFDSKTRPFPVDQQSQLLTIAIAGTIKPWNPWRDVIRATNEVSSEKATKIRIIFIGTTINESIRSYAKEHSTECEVMVVDRLSHKESIRYLCESNVLLLFNNYALLGTKIFEYLSLNRHILFCYNSENSFENDKLKYSQVYKMIDMDVQCQQKLIERHQGGYIANDYKCLKEHLYRLVVEFRSKRKIESNSINTDELSREKQIEMLERNLQQLITN